MVWDPQILPSAIALTTHPPASADPKFQLSADVRRRLAQAAADQILKHKGATFRVAAHDDGMEPPAILLPFDQLFEARVAAALRLWRVLAGRDLGRDPQALSPARRDRLILALRALDGRLADASYRDIAAGLFGPERLPERGWKSHDLRDRTIRLVRFGMELMQGGYRRLLRHPYRGRA